MFLRLDVAQLTRSEMIEMIQDYDVFEQEGAIGQCKLRTFAREIRERNGHGTTSIGIGVLMRDIVFEIYRRLAKENIRNG